MKKIFLGRNLSSLKVSRSIVKVVFGTLTTQKEKKEKGSLWWVLTAIKNPVV